MQDAAADIRRHLELLFQPGDVFEVRAPNTIQRKGSDYAATASGYFTFDAIDQAVEAITQLDESGQAPACYVTMNPVQPALLARAMNRLRIKARATTKDSGIVSRRWLVVDVDPARPADVSSTDAELEMAHEMATRIRESLPWPEPVVAESGNGVHLVYRIDLPTDDGGLLQRVLESISKHFSDETCKVDRTMYNPARITKIVGTVARKGDSLQGVVGVEDRPHRRARFVHIPDEISIVTREKLELVAGDKVTSPVPKVTSSACDNAGGHGGLDGTVSGTRAWLESHGLQVKGSKETSQGTMLYLEVCPVTGTVSTGNSDIAVGVAADGSLSYHNRHDRGEGVTWADVRAVLDPRPDTPQMVPGVDLGGLLAPPETPPPPPEADPDPPPPGWRPFPTDALPEPVATYVRAVAQAQMLDEATVAVPLLAGLAGAVNASRCIQVKPGWLEPCIVWSCVVMRSGDGKSHALDAGVDFLREYQLREFARFKEEERLHELDCKLHPDDPPEAPRPPKRVIANDTTVEGLAMLLAENHRGIMMERDELAGWLGSFDRYARSSGGDRPFWLSAHGGRSHLIDRKTTKPLMIPACAVSITGTIQPSVFENMVSEQDRESGLLARILVAYPPTPVQVWTDEVVPANVKGDMAEIFNWLLELDRTPSQDGETSKPIVIPFSRRAQRSWIHWFNAAKKRQRESPTDDHAANWSKQIGYGARLALLFELIMRAATHLNEDYNALRTALDQHGRDVRREALKGAIKVVEWFVYESERIHERTNAPETTKELMKLKEWIERRGGRCTAREAYSSLRRYRGQLDQAKADLDALVEAGEGQWEAQWTEGQRGAGTKVFVLAERQRSNPSVPALNGPGAIENGVD